MFSLKEIRAFVENYFDSVTIEELRMTSLEKFVFVDVREGNIVSTEEKTLTLAYENLNDMPRNLADDYGRVVEILDLSHNRISNVEFLTNFEKVTTLILDHNHISSDVSFPRVPTLTTLWLNHNLIDKLHPFIESVQKGFPNLKFLSLMGNSGAPSYLNGGTYYEYLQYRLFVISWFPKLEYLDDRPVTSDQREEAARLYSRPFYLNLTKLQLPHYLQSVQRRVKFLVETWTPRSRLGPPATDLPPNRVV